jgi:hypothetical protein
MKNICRYSIKNLHKVPKGGNDEKRIFKKNHISILINVYISKKAFTLEEIGDDDE